MAERLDRHTLESAAAEALARGVDRDPRELLRWAHGLLGDQLMMSTAFGKSGMVILHMVKDVAPDLPVYFIDTGFHFRETLDFVKTLENDLGLRIRVERPVLTLEQFNAEYGEKLYERDPDLCCHRNKVEPFARLLDRYQGWIAGIRRDQAATRAHAESLEILESNQLKVQPLVHWTRLMVERYLTENRVPLHPLFSRGYTSVGCEPCTRPAVDADDERSGRWAGTSKTECGLHLFRKKAKPNQGSPSSSASPAASA